MFCCLSFFLCFLHYQTVRKQNSCPIWPVIEIYVILPSYLLSGVWTNYFIIELTLKSIIVFIQLTVYYLRHFGIYLTLLFNKAISRSLDLIWHLHKLPEANTFFIIYRLCVPYTLSAELDFQTYHVLWPKSRVRSLWVTGPFSETLVEESLKTPTLCHGASLHYTTMHFW